MTTLEEVRDTLFLFPRHVCCESARFLLWPPRHGTDGYIDVDIGQLKCNPIDRWYLDDGDGGGLLFVAFCPWCGERLPVEPPLALGEKLAEVSE